MILLKPKNQRRWKNIGLHYLSSIRTNVLTQFILVMKETSKYLLIGFLNLGNLKNQKIRLQSFSSDMERIVANFITWILWMGEEKIHKINFKILEHFWLISKETFNITLSFGLLWSCSEEHKKSWNKAGVLWDCATTSKVLLRSWLLNLLDS